MLQEDCSTCSYPAALHAKAFRENVAAIVSFYTPSAKTTKAIFEEYAGELAQDDRSPTLSFLFATLSQLN